MSMSDPLGDLITRIRNGQRLCKASVSAPSSRMALRVLDVLKEEGYIRSYSTDKLREGISTVSIELKYHEGLPAIREVSRVSKPGRRVYSKITKLGKVYNGLGVFILSTSRGVVSDSQARDLNVGGEVLFRVF